MAWAPRRLPRAAALRVREEVRFPSAFARPAPRRVVRVAADAVRRMPRAAPRAVPRATWAAPRAISRAPAAVRLAPRLAAAELPEVVRRRLERVRLDDPRLGVGEIVRAGEVTVPTAERATSAATSAPVRTTDPTVPRTVPTPEATVSTTPRSSLLLLFAIG